MPFHLVLSDSNFPFRVLFWVDSDRDACLGKAKCPDPDLCPRRGDDGNSAQQCFWCLYTRCPDVTEQEREKFLFLITQYVRTGRFLTNRQKFKPIEHTKHLYSLKPSSQLRLIGSYREGAFVIVACCRKKRDDYPRGELHRYERLWENSLKEKLVVR